MVAPQPQSLFQAHYLLHTAEVPPTTPKRGNVLRIMPRSQRRLAENTGTNVTFNDSVSGYFFYETPLLIGIQVEMKCISAPNEKS